MSLKIVNIISAGVVGAISLHKNMTFQELHLLIQNVPWAMSNSKKDKRKREQEKSFWEWSRLNCQALSIYLSLNHSISER